MKLNPPLNTSGMEHSQQQIGIVQNFRFNQQSDVEEALIDLKKLGISHIRTTISLSDWDQTGAKEWFNYLFTALSEYTEILPCLVAEPTASTTNISTCFANFVHDFTSTFGSYFNSVQLWHEPNNPQQYNYTVDNDWQTFCQATIHAAILCKEQGKKVVLGGMKPADPNWLRLMFERGVMEHIDTIAVHCTATTKGITNAKEAISAVQAIADQFGSGADIWITAAGFSTSQKNEAAQLKAFINLLDAPAARMYWNNLKDVSSFENSDYLSEEERSSGLKNSDGTPKLLYTLLATKGLKHIREYEWMTKTITGKTSKKKYTLITGGAGFVGTNLADRLLSNGQPVLIFDNLSRAGVQNNLFWLKRKHPDNLLIMIADIRNRQAITEAVKNAEQVYHFAAQVAVTSSLTHPFHDFEVNAQGTLNLLEAIRYSDSQPPVIFTSTNKVYGDLHDIGMVMNNSRYTPENAHFRQHGIGEDRNLDFHSPYGCTKGVADQYILDYSRTFGIKSTVFRMSCIYGPHQFGTEDQGWVAHFLIQALKNKPITLYGDGKQVRDILFIDDLVDAFLLAQSHIDRISGQAFNIGGGVQNTVSLLELVDLIGDIAGEKPFVQLDEWRPSDQKYYVSNFAKFNHATGWRPQVNTPQGVERLYEWLRVNADISTKKEHIKTKKEITAVA